MDPVGIDHVVVAASDIDTGRQWALRELGAAALEGGRHPRWNTRNALVGLGAGTYLEILAPDDEVPGSGDGPEKGVGRETGVGAGIFGVERISAPVLAGWALRTTRIERDRERARRQGLEVGPVLEGRRERPDGTILRWRLTDPSALPEGGAVPFLIDWMDSEHPSQRLDQPCRLEELRLHAPYALALRRFLYESGIGRAGRIVVEAAARPGLTARIRTPVGSRNLESRSPGRG